MKQRFFVLLGLVFALSILTGCEGWSRNKSGVEVIIEGGGEFPQSLAGRWKANESGWEFVFEPDGRISSAVISMGRTEIIPGQSKTVQMKMGGKGIYEPGLWTVRYYPLSRELLVEIVMDYIHLEFGPSLLEGKRTDVLWGEVSEDGKIWRAEWFNFPDYIAYTPEPKRLTNVDPDDAFVKTLIFEKFEE